LQFSVSVQYRNELSSYLINRAKCLEKKYDVKHELIDSDASLDILPVKGLIL